jgi:single-strand DNA-binding protein
LFLLERYLRWDAAHSFHEEIAISEDLRRKAHHPLSQAFLRAVLRSTSPHQFGDLTTPDRRFRKPVLHPEMRVILLTSGVFMSRSVNKVILIGNLGRDAETSFTPTGVAVTKFSVATTHSWKDQSSDEWKDEVNWTNVVLWRNENLASYLTKGQQVYLEGRLQSRSYEDKDGRRVYVTEVISEEIVLLGGSKERSTLAAAPPPGRPQPAPTIAARR